MTQQNPRISFPEDEMMVLLSWAFSGGEFKPDLSFDADKKLLKKLKTACDKLGIDFEEFYSDKNYDEYGIEIDEDEIKREKERFSNPDGIFRCPKCQINTNEKTYKTRCVICDTGLIRNAH